MNNIVDSENRNIDFDLQGHLNDGFIAYRMYLALRQHFNPDNKYHYNSLRTKKTPNYSLVKCSKESYQQRKNVIYFTKLSKMFKGNLAKIEDYLIANILKNPKWGGGILTDDESVDVYKEWLRRVESLMYLFERDNKHLRKACKTYYEKLNRWQDMMYYATIDEGAVGLANYDEESWGKVSKSVELNSVYFNVCVLSPAGMHPLLVRETLGGRIAVETLTLFCELSGCHREWDETDPSINAGVSRVLSYASLLEYDREAARSVMRAVWHPI